MAVITHDSHRHALRSTRNRPRRAVRRGAAWPTAERPSSCLVVQQAVSRAGRCLTAEPSWSPSAACAADRTMVRRPSGHRLIVVPRYPDAYLPCLGRPVRVLCQRPRLPVHCPTSGACPASGACVRCPVSARASPLVQCPASGACPVSGWESGVRPSGVQRPASRVRCSVPGVRCPVSGASVRHPCIPRPRPRCPYRRAAERGCGRQPHG
jgi:hypothetical protein